MIVSYSKRITLLVLFWMGWSFPAPGAETPPRKLLLISVDGTRPDALLLADTPNLDSLFVESAFTYRAQCAVPDEDYSISGSCYSSLFTGVWCAKHGVCENSFTNSRYDLYPIAFCRLRDVYPGMVIQSIVRWAPISSEMIECADVDLAPSSDAAATAEAVRLLTETDPDILYFHIEDVDTAGHQVGFSPEAEGYLEAIEKSDGRVGEVLQALRSRPSFEEEDWMVIALTDHGGKDKSHHYRDEPEAKTIFMTFQGSHVAPGELDPPPVIADIGPTILAYFGIDIDPSWDLDGKVVPLSGGSRQLPADCDQNGNLEISDVICLLAALFSRNPAPLPCGYGTLEGDNLALLDSNGDSSADVSDAVYVLFHLFAGGQPPVAGTRCVPLPTCPDACIDG